MKRWLTKIFLVTLLFLVTRADAQYKFNKLVWSDDFNQTSPVPDTAKWGYDNGNGCPQVCGWGNNELQYYTTSRIENARVENGRLILTARKEAYQGAKYTSARMVTRNKGDWKYGRMEISAKLPAGRGMWPAIWMLPTKWEYGIWPHSGEIDIMENVGYWPDSLFATVHTGLYNGMRGTQKVKSMTVKDLSSAFHTYAVEWTQDDIVFYLDEKITHRFANEHTGSEAWPFDKEFYLLLNIAIGGNWGGKYGIDETIFPQQMEVEFVRVFQ